MALPLAVAGRGILPPTSQRPCCRAWAARKGRIGPLPAHSAAAISCRLRLPKAAKHSGSSTSSAPCCAASAIRTAAASRLAWTSAPLIICMAATRDISILQGRLVVEGPVKFHGGLHPAAADAVAHGSEAGDLVAQDAIDQKQYPADLRCPGNDRRQWQEIGRASCRERG